MLSYLFKFVRWLFEKFAAATLIAGLGLLAVALWLYLKDNVDFDQWRADTVRAITGERAKITGALDDVHKRMDRISLEIQAEQGRAQLADNAMAKLHDLESTWDKYVGNRAQQQANAEQLEKLSETRRALTTRIAGLQQDFTRATWERDGLEIALGKINGRLEAVQAQQSRVFHYLDRAWNRPVGRGPMRLAVKWWVAIALGLYFLGPTAGKITLYFFVAPFIARGRPVRLAKTANALPEIGASGVSAELSLRPGERLWIKEKFLQASDEPLRKETRYLLDWRLPFTCLATGLVELIEMRNDGTGEPKVTLSNQSDPHSELAVVTLASGAALVLRPSFLAGVVVAEGERLRVRRRWQFFRWQAWVTLQFRFFEFVGPCRLIVAGRRGVRVEDLSTRMTDRVPARRANQDATMGFTPNLDYRPVRAETFWSYYRGMNPLFDDLFAGRGMFLCQQVAADGEAKRARKFWSGVWGGVMKVFGL
jgi:hypothetical protein